MYVHVIISVECLYIVINKCPVIAGCGHMRSAATVDYIAHWSYMRGVVT